MILQVGVLKHVFLPPQFCPAKSHTGREGSSFLGRYMEAHVFLSNFRVTFFFCRHGQFHQFFLCVFFFWTRPSLRGKETLLITIVVGAHLVDLPCNHLLSFGVWSVCLGLRNRQDVFQASANRRERLMVTEVIIPYKWPYTWV